MTETANAEKKARRIGPLTYSFDDKCEDLARYFLGGSSHQNTVAELAQHIQDTIEDWMED